jgi:DNA-binding MarR family transcriptional regulator
MSNCPSGSDFCAARLDVDANAVVKTHFQEAARKIALECTCMRVRQVSRTVSRIYDENLRRAGLHISQVTVLVAVARFGEGGTGIGRLAQVLGMDRTTLTRNLLPLEKAGLLRVARDPTDARARIVLLTKAGERAIEEAFPLWEKSQKRLRDLVGKRQAHDLHERLARLLAAVPP